MKATNKNAKVKISRKNLMIKNKNELNKKNKSQIYERYIKVNKKKIYTPKKRNSIMSELKFPGNKTSDLIKDIDYKSTFE